MPGWGGVPGVSSARIGLSCGMIGPAAPPPLVLFGEVPLVEPGFAPAPVPPPVFPVVLPEPPAEPLPPPAWASWKLVVLSALTVFEEQSA